MIKLVAFDLDGTVADTLEDLANAVNDALLRTGLSGYPTDDYRHFVGNGLDNLVHTVLGENDTEQRFEDVKTGFQRYYAAHSRDCTKPYPGIARLLDLLSGDGVRTVVLSNKPDEFVPGILHALYPDHHFDLMWGQQARFPRKPAPDSLTAALKALDVSRDEALYVGDSNVDVRYAHAAGLRVIGVSWGFRGRTELIAAGADAVVDSADELYRQIKEFSHE